MSLPDEIHTKALAAIASIRDSVLHERGPLAEAGADNDIINAVLGIIDDETTSFESAAAQLADSQASRITALEAERDELSAILARVNENTLKGMKIGDETLRTVCEIELLAKALIAKNDALEAELERQKKLIADSAEAVRENVTFRRDGERLNLLGRKCIGLVPYDIPTGSGDADVGWKLLQWNIGEKEPRVLAQVNSEDPRDVIDELLTQLKDQ